MKVLIRHLPILLCIFAAGCAANDSAIESGKANTDSGSPNRNQSPSEIVNPKGEAIDKKQNDPASASPEEVVKRFYRAYREKDVAAFKELISSKVLKNMQEQVNEENKNLDLEIKRMMINLQIPFNGDPEIRNLKISNNNATLEINYGDHWQIGKLIKEKGQWKINPEE